MLHVSEEYSATFALVRVESIQCRCPTPESAKHLPTIIFPPPCFNVGLIACRIVCLLLLQILNLDSSINKSFFPAIHCVMLLHLSQPEYLASFPLLETGLETDAHPWRPLHHRLTLTVLLLIRLLRSSLWELSLMY